jgi:hypothetical protein
MKNTTTAIAPPAAQAARSTGWLARLRDWLWDLDDLSPEEARRRMRSKPGFLGSLSPEVLDELRRYDGPENLGPPLTRKERRARG